MDEILNHENNDKEISDADYKELMAKIKAAVTVFREKHRGQVPTLDDINELLSQEEVVEKSEEYDVPKILKMKAYYGKDPEKPVCFEDAEGLRFFDLKNGSWSMNAPANIDHFNVRDFKESDMLTAILNGLLDHSEYTALHKAGLVDPTCEQLYAKISTLKSQHAALEKSMESIFEEDVRPEAYLEGLEPISHAEDFMVLDFAEEELPGGQDLVSELIQLASSPDSNPRLIKTIRAQICLALGKTEQELFPNV